jgi:pyroglutamyl-peptidase
MKLTPKILLTSFQPWLSHHRSNSSDDLLKQLENHNFMDLNLLFLRQLPVDTYQSSKMVLDAVEFHQPHGIICCGMAEKRTQLTMESCAVWQQEKQQIIP